MWSFWCNDNNSNYIGKIFGTFFLWEGQGHFWGDKDQIYLGRAKGRGKRGYGGEAQNETNFKSPPLQLTCPKTYMQELSSDFKQFFLVKNNLLTSVHNDTDAIDDTDVYNRVIGIALLIKA